MPDLLLTAKMLKPQLARATRNGRAQILTFFLQQKNRKNLVFPAFLGEGGICLLLARV